MTIRDILDYIAQDHCWLYAVIADKRMMVQRQAYWKRTPREHAVTESVVLVTHEADGTDTIKTPTREIRGVTPQYAVHAPDSVTYTETIDG